MNKLSTLLSVIRIGWYLFATAFRCGNSDLSFSDIPVIWKRSKAVVDQIQEELKEVLEKESK